MSAKTKQALWAMLVCTLTEGACLLALGWGGASGRIDAAHLKTPLLLSAGLAAAGGTLFLSRSRRGWRVIWAAMLTGPVFQLLLMGAGWFAFGGVSLDGGRWQLPIAGFAAACLTALLPGKRGKGKSSAGRKRGKRKGA